MLSVYKYQVPIRDYFNLTLPLNAEVLHVDIQYNEMQLWALVDPNTGPGEIRRFRLVGTGHEITEKQKNLKYINTFFMYEGALVWHVFEIID